MSLPMIYNVGISSLDRSLNCKKPITVPVPTEGPDRLYLQKLVRRKKTEEAVRRQQKSAIFIIPGGPFWSESSTLVHASYISRSLGMDVYTVFKSGPVNFFGDRILRQIAECVQEIKRLEPGKRIYCIGISTGGLVLNTYVVSRVGQRSKCHRYYTLSTTADVDEFKNSIDSSPVLWFMKAGSVREMWRQNAVEWQSSRLGRYLRGKNILGKLAALPPRDRPLQVFGTRDSISKSFPETLDRLGITEYVLVVDGVHCGIYVTTALAERVLHDIDDDDAVDDAMDDAMDDAAEESGPEDGAPDGSGSEDGVID